MPAYPTFPGVDLHQVSSGLHAFTSLFGMGRGGTHRDKTPANIKTGFSTSNAITFKRYCIRNLKLYSDLGGYTIY